ncbi:hypothetical protein IAT38_003278 [Cryptococcus sp. DSM 104549]
MILPAVVPTDPLRYLLINQRIYSTVAIPSIFRELVLHPSLLQPLILGDDPAAVKRRREAFAHTRVLVINDASTLDALRYLAEDGNPNIQADMFNGVRRLVLSREVVCVVQIPPAR